MNPVRKLGLGALASLMLALPGSASAHCEHKQQHQEHGAHHMGEEASKGRVMHLVFIWLKPESKSEEAVQALIAAQESLRTIPGLVSLDIARPIPSDRPIVDSSYDIVSQFVFPDAETMRAYLSHPTHVAFLKDPAQQAVARIQVYDYTIAP